MAQLQLLIFFVDALDYKSVIAELQLCFVLLVLLANYSAAEQWKRLLELLCTSQSAVCSQSEIYKSFIDTLEAQFQCIPEVYFTDMLGSNFVKKQLRTLRRNITNPNSFTSMIPGSEADNHLSTPFRDQMLTKLSTISGLLNEKFGVDLETSGTAAAARKRRQAQSTLSMLSGGFSAPSANGFEAVHHYGSDDEDGDGDAVNGSSRFGDVYDSDDEDEERGEYAPVIVEM